jgi:hypothetical protein
MTIQIELLGTPATDTSPGEAITYLGYFVDWLEGFFYQVSENLSERDPATGAPLFNAAQIEFLPGVLAEMGQDKHFSRLREAVANADPQALEQHGLYGAQLRWKLSNINFSLARFIEQPTSVLFHRLLDSIDALLDSLVGAVPGGSAVKELKEAVRNSTALATQ